MIGQTYITPAWDTKWSRKWVALILSKGSLIIKQQNTVRNCDSTTPTSAHYFRCHIPKHEQTNTQNYHGTENYLPPKMSLKLPPYNRRARWQKPWKWHLLINFCCFLLARTTQTSYQLALGSHKNNSIDEGRYLLQFLSFFPAGFPANATHATQWTQWTQLT